MYVSSGSYIPTTGGRHGANGRAILDYRAASAHLARQFEDRQPDRDQRPAPHDVRGCKWSGLPPKSN